MNRTNPREGVMTVTRHAVVLLVVAAAAVMAGMTVRLRARARARTVIAHFRDASGVVAAVATFRATIDWGDDTASRGVVAARGHGADSALERAAGHEALDGGPDARKAYISFVGYLQASTETVVE